MRKYLFIFALLAISLAACRVESNILLDINEDGSASVGAEIGFDEEFQNLLEQSGADPDEILTDLPDFGGDSVQPIERTEGDMTFLGATSQVDDLSTFDFASGGGDEFFSEFSYEFDASSAKLEATVTAADLGGGGEDLPIDPSALTGDLFSANVIIKMPGNVAEHNADEVRSDGTLVWEVSLTDSTQISATSDFGSGASTWIWFVLGGVLIIGIIAAITATIVSRKDADKAVAAAAAAHEAAPPVVPPPTGEPVDVDTGSVAPASEEVSGDASASEPETDASEGDTNVAPDPGTDEPIEGDQPETT
ncbi:MAG: hypothetical protein GWP18_04090 [Proteobacteria bacterium]|nr:hypothetical protein [Pseudomonadota bacterium]